MELTNEIKEKVVPVTTQEGALIEELFSLTEPESMPYKANMDTVIAECYRFKEGDHWTDEEESDLKQYGVPPLPVDRIDRNLSVLDGLRDNTNSDIKISPVEMGDFGTAQVLNEVKKCVESNSRIEEVRDDNWEQLRDVGMGITKFGVGIGTTGQKEIWFEEVPLESAGWSRTRRKDMSDLRWFWHKQIIDWESAIRLSPEKADQIKAKKQTKTDEYNKIKTSSGNDYSTEVGTVDKKLEYPNQVEIYEFWVKKVTPYKIVNYQEDMVQMIGDIEVSIPQVKAKKVPTDYALQEGEQDLQTGVDEFWVQHITCGEKNDAILLTPIEGKTSQYSFLSYQWMVAEFTKNGRPRGFIEKVIPFQKRINLSWGQKTAFNNKAIKAPLIIEGEVDLTTAVKMSDFGAIFQLPLGGAKIVQLNTVPNIDLQAVEEGNMARMDMDFAAAASEPVMRGVSQSGDSGIKTAMNRDAAVTPLNRWIKADKLYLKNLWKKVIQMIITEFPPEQMARMVGEQKFMALTQGQPLVLDVAYYDVKIEDQSISDYKKIQSFNTTMAINQSFPLTGEYVIGHAPIENPEDAIQSFQQQKMDMMNMLMAENQMLKDQLQQTEKLVPKENKSQAKNAQTGKNQPQAGTRSNIGGSRYSGQP